MHARQSQGAEDAPHVLEELAHRVCLDALGLVRLAEAPQVGRDHPEAGVHQRANLVTPDVAGVGKAVEQEDTGPGARVHH
jgi:hypothetical protein